MPKSKILIVDDEPFNLDYLEQELADLDYEPIRAVNGVEALELVQAQSPDLILLDIMMPIMDGFEVLRWLKANPNTRHIPVIIISAHSDLNSMVRGIQSGAEDYLPKPFEPILLEARISSSLEKKRLRDVEQQYLKSLEREFEIAREIQAGFLPAELPKIPGWELATYFRAAKEVAGDYYDAFQLPDGHLLFLVGDVCGKGVGAALFMTLFRSLIRATATTDQLGKQATSTGISPAERLSHIVSFTNEYIYTNHGDSSMFTTLFIGCIQPETGLLTYINCGNEAALIFRDGGLNTSLAPTGPVVGILPEVTFRVKQVQLASGDLLLGFTDGIPDCQNAHGEFFGHDRILEFGITHQPGSADLIKALASRLEEFSDPEYQFDDITMLAIHRA